MTTATIDLVTLAFGVFTLLEDAAAVAGTEGVCLFTDKVHIATVPTTGQVITVSANEGDAEVFFSSDGPWCPVFHWHEGRPKVEACWRAV